uniref:JmjC domain-containing protein n=1 Tax=Caenorhabditis tropicalis TaxID=1561998 RepID=A0A1I7V007_9PELO
METDVLPICNVDESVVYCLTPPTWVHSLIPSPDAIRFSSIPDIPRAKSALNVLVASNWRSFLEDRGVLTENNMQMSEGDESDEEAYESYMSLRQ